MSKTKYDVEMVDDCLDIYNFNMKMYESEKDIEFKYRAQEQLEKIQNHLHLVGAIRVKKELSNCEQNVNSY